MDQIHVFKKEEQGMNFNRLFVAAAAVCVAAFLAIGQDSSAVKSKEAPMKTVKAGKYTFSYRIDSTNLVATVSCKTQGWIAVGFNPKSVMQNANFIMGSVVDGKAVVSDEFGDNTYSHKPDTAIGGKNNIIAGDCTQADGVTTLSFTIPLDSGDAKDGKLVPGSKVKLIFASGATNDIRKKHKDDTKTTITLYP
jgi:hypothetical protein